MLLKLQFAAKGHCSRKQTSWVHPGGPPNLLRIIVSQTISYIVSFNFLRQAVQNGRFLG